MKEIIKKVFINAFIYSWVLVMVLFSIGCPIAAVGYALVGDYWHSIVSIILCITGIGGYAYLLQNER